MTEFWRAPLAETVRNSQRVAGHRVQASDVGNWLESYTEEAPTSSNQGAGSTPFQRWFHFKEAFSPKFVADTLGALPYKVDRCLDPFGGSGTTAVTARMLGISSTVVEVNPFLADLIEAKLTPVPAARFCASYECLMTGLEIESGDSLPIEGMPLTMAEPGLKGRFVFAANVYATVRAIVRASARLPTNEARLLKVLLGAVLVRNSNVTINGKGRRYRRGWEARRRSPADLIASLDDAVDKAAADLTSYAGLRRGKHVVLRGDARSALARVEQADVAIFSPPYPNSFDYTDVYNLELWMLGYLNSTADNRALRHLTLRSHVQMKWRMTQCVAKSEALRATLDALGQARADLWNPHIPEMIGYYFDDLAMVFAQLRRILAPGRHVVIAIGDSQYGGIHVDVASILVECVLPLGFRLAERGAIRSMRNSSQHGGGFKLSEHCLVFERV